MNLLHLLHLLHKLGLVIINEELLLMVINGESMVEHVACQQCTGIFTLHIYNSSSPLPQLDI